MPNLPVARLAAACLLLAACHGASKDGSSTAPVTGRCGDGKPDPGEQCDAGGESATCNLDCTLAACGDSKVNATAGEECDRGAANSDDADCTSACKLNVCGDGKVDRVGPGRHEECDDGNQVETDGCSNGCRLPRCGNGVVDPPEECDDANPDDTDGCARCAYARCGDGFVRAGVELCDDGNTIAGDGCSPKCTLEVCGNGNLDAGEQCDDGNTASGDGCSGPGSPLGACKLERCGDGVVNAGEACDRAATPATCNLDCTVSRCGDGKVNPTTEQCDDANEVTTDGCHQCRLTRCGNGALDPGEECDGTVNAGPYGCSAECFRIACGNGRLDPGEECDDGNASDSDDCISSNPAPSTCKIARCGDGHVNSGGSVTEQCDDGPNNSYSGACLPTCRHNVCGDGFRDVSHEACDDGNRASETSCPYGQASCTGCNATCTAVVALTGNVCGDGVRDPVHEECDDQNSATEGSCPYGAANCTVCSSTCTLVERTGSTCGDGVIDAPYETCDDGNASTCGSCSSDCRTVQAARATGLIVAVPAADIGDGTGFTLADGLGAAVRFEFDKDATATGTPVVLTGDTASGVASKIAAAVNASGLALTAVARGSLVQLTHDVPTFLGNVAISETVASADFVVSGMAGGAGGDCGPGVGCTSNADCASGTCSPYSPRTCQ